jgi:hypothetical protein
MSRVGVSPSSGKYQSASTVRPPATGIVRVDVDQSDERTVGYMLANNTALVQIVKPVMEEMLASDRGDQFRRDLRPKDLAQFFISTSISMHAARRHTGHRGSRDGRTLHRCLRAAGHPWPPSKPATRVP